MERGIGWRISRMQEEAVSPKTASPIGGQEDIASSTNQRWHVYDNDANNYSFDVVSESSIWNELLALVKVAVSGAVVAAWTELFALPYSSSPSPVSCLL